MTPTAEPSPAHDVALLAGADDAWRHVVARSIEHDDPCGGPDAAAAAASALAAPAAGSRRLLWAARDGDALLGGASLRLYDDEGRRHAAALDLHVDPARRRAGVGSALLAAALGTARAEARRSVTVSVTDGTAGVAFAEARGLRRVLAVRHLLLRLADVAAEPPVVHRAADGGYRIVRWTGVVPDELAPAFAVAKVAMEDMPVGEMDAGHPTWDADRVRQMARTVLDRGDALLTVAAVTPDGKVAGFTEVVVPGGSAARALQYDTAVVPAHRGHRLGLAVKSDLARWLRREHPEVREVETDNAEDNVHMLRVNEELGFRPTRRTFVYQADLG